MRKLSALLLLCIVSGLAVCGGAYAAPRTHLNIGMAAEVTSLDPSRSPDCVTPTGYAYTGQIFEQLLQFDQNTREFIPVLATDWEISPDAMEVVFTLKEGVKFHNGDAMTADDVVFSLTRALESPYTTSVNGSIDHFEKVDDTHIKVVLKYAYVPILQVLDVPCWGIVSKRAVEEMGDEAFARNPIGTGAYKMVNWISGQRVEYEAFEEYHGGAAPIKTVHVVLLPDQTAGSLALEEGSIDFNQGVPKTDIPYMETLDNLTVIQLTSGSVNDIHFNVTDGYFADKRLRQAVAYAINLEDILIGGAEGYGTIANILCSPKAWGYVEDIQPYEQNIEKAKQLMAEAGYPNGFDVVMDQDSGETYMPTAEMVQAQLKEIGINITFNKLERAAWFDLVSDKREFQITTRMTTMALFDIDYMVSRRLLSTALGNGNNYSGYSNPEMDALIDAGRREPDDVKRLSIYRQIYEIIKEDVPTIPLYNYAEFICHNSKLMGVQPVSANRNLWRLMYFVE